VPQETKLHRALFLDRDGVINEETHYLYKREDVRWVEGIFSLTATATRLGYRIIVVSNQAGVARGYFTEADVDSLMEWMGLELAARGGPLTAVYYCPYHPHYGDERYRREHEDRKPSPGMLHRAAREHALDLSQSVMVGDRCTDIGAANNAGLRQAFLIAGTEDAPCGGDYLAVESLAEVECWLVANAPQPS
jgi:D-glycero-D-manno-heptose 1,7-bisphosphate phosphatase